MLCKMEQYFIKNMAVKPNIEIRNAFILCTIHRAENTDDETRLEVYLKP